GKPEVAEVERTLRLEMAKKMIIDFDYLPLPAIPGDDKPAKKGKGKAKAKADVSAERSPLFKKLDTDEDGKLSRAEFSVSRSAADASEWFARRDADGDGFMRSNLTQPRHFVGAFVLPWPSRFWRLNMNEASGKHSKAIRSANYASRLSWRASGEFLRLIRLGLLCYFADG
ncbi:MAG: hypothetical protein EBU04_07545, partial [Verrucomicrobia bacterium]|nr:hypothetical protein [Verrucomicrobiota bacterium]